MAGSSPAMTNVDFVQMETRSHALRAERAAPWRLRYESETAETVQEDEMGQAHKQSLQMGGR
jgi:hypothetical protein